MILKVRQHYLRPGFLMPLSVVHQAFFANHCRHEYENLQPEPLQRVQAKDSQWFNQGPFARSWHCMHDAIAIQRVRGVAGPELRSSLNN